MLYCSGWTEGGQDCRASLAMTVGCGYGDEGGCGKGLPRLRCQLTRMVRKMIDHEGGDEMVAVVVTGMAAQS